MDLFNQPCADVLVIGVGALGCAVAGRGALNDASECPRQAEWSAIHAQSSELFATGLDQRLHLMLPPGPISDAAVGLVLEARADEWKRWCAGKRSILIVAADDDAFATCVAHGLAGLLRDSGAGLLIVQAGTGESVSECHGEAVLRAVLPEAAANVSPRAVEALQRAQTLEIVEACLGALRADSAASPWLSESFAEFLRWGRMEARVGSADSIDAIQAAVRQLPCDDAEAMFLVVHGAEERSTTELSALRASLELHAARCSAVSVLSVEGRCAGDGLFWMRLSRRALSGNVVRLDAVRPATTSAAFART